MFCPPVVTHSTLQQELIMLIPPPKLPRPCVTAVYTSRPIIVQDRMGGAMMYIQARNYCWNDLPTSLIYYRRRCLPLLPFPSPGEMPIEGEGGESDAGCAAARMHTLRKIYEKSTIYEKLAFRRIRQSIPHSSQLTAPTHSTLSTVIVFLCQAAACTSRGVLVR